METEQFKALNKESVDGTFNLKEFLMKYIHYTWLFIICLVVALFCAWVYLRYTKPMYQVSSTMLIRNDQSSRGGGSSQGDNNMFADLALFQSTTNKQNEMQILSSRSMMERVIRALDLQLVYYASGNVKITNLYKNQQPVNLRILKIADSTREFSITIRLKANNTFTLNDSEKIYNLGDIIEVAWGTFKVVKNPEGNINQKNIIATWSPVFSAAARLQGQLAIKSADDMSTVLNLTCITENPQLGADIVNQLVVEYNKAAIEDKNAINKKILAFINDRIDLVESQLINVESDLLRYKTNRQIIDLKAQSEMYFGNKSELDKNILQQEIQLQVAGLVEDYIKQPQNKFTLVPSTLGLTDPTLLELVTVYNKLAAERLGELQTGATLDNPFIKNLEIEIENARLNILSNLSNIKQSYRNAINTLTVQSNLLRKEITSIPEKEQQGREKARQQEIKQNLYLYLLQKREESEIAQAAVIGSSRVIDEALPSYNRVSPVLIKIYTIAIILGLIVPVLIIYLIELFNDKVTTRSDIEKVTNAPILAEVGHNTSEDVLLFAQRTKSIIAEQFRIFRSNMRFQLGNVKHSPVILVTSSFSGEGKSFVSTNIGAALAVSGKKTVILEFDLRKPKVLSGLKLSKSQGITNYLVGAAKLQDLATPVPQVDGLFVIPCGPVPPNPSELLMTSQIQDLFVWLRQHFDAIIVDTAPIGLVSDAMNLGVYADATIYVVRQRYTFKRQLYLINNLHEQNKLPRIGLLVNDIITKGIQGYYGYGNAHYGYGYGYGYGYYDEEKKRGWLRRLFRIKK